MPYIVRRIAWKGDTPGGRPVSLPGDVYKSTQPSGTAGVNVYLVKHVHVKYNCIRVSTYQDTINLTDSTYVRAMLLFDHMCTLFLRYCLH